MSRGRTFSEIAFAGDTQDPDLPVEWARGVATQILKWVWQAFDRLRVGISGSVDLAKPFEQLERDLSRLHYVDLLDVWRAETDGFSTLRPVMEWPEMETRSSAPAKPPAYDFAFVHSDHRRWAWPIEAKVLTTPGNLHEYMADVRNKFVAGIAAPLVGEGAMIAYLISGTPEAVFAKLQKQLATTLDVVPEFADRPHRTSNHQRTSSPALRLHHMIMVCV